MASDPEAKYAIHQAARDGQSGFALTLNTENGR